MHIVHDVKSEVREAIRPQVVTRSHPWVMTGTAAATGFAFASAIISRVRKQPEGDAPGRGSWFSPTGGLAAVGMAVLPQLLQASSGRSLPMVMGTLFKLWKRRQASTATRSTNEKDERRR